jgi:hypothetical protein
MSLPQSSQNRQAIFHADNTDPWELRLAKAFDEANGHIVQSFPAGKRINLAKHELASSVAGSQFSRDENFWDGKMNDRSVHNVDEVRGISIASDEASDYYLGKFSIASKNIGAYISGYAREQVVKGNLSEKQFNQACEDKLRDLSDIIYLGRTGHLRAIISPDEWMKSNDMEGDKLVCFHDSLGVGKRSGISGLGEPMSLLTAGVILVIAAIVIAAGVAVTFYFMNHKRKMQQLGFDLCQDAIRNNDPRWEEICEQHVPKGSSGILPRLDDLIPPDTTNQIVKYAAAGLGIALLINFLPNIMASLSRTQEVYADEKLRKLQKYQQYREMQALPPGVDTLYE